MTLCWLATAVLCFLSTVKDYQWYFISSNHATYPLFHDIEYLCIDWLLPSYLCHDTECLCVDWLLPSYISWALLRIMRAHSYHEVSMEYLLWDEPSSELSCEPFGMVSSVGSSFWFWNPGVHFSLLFCCKGPVIIIKAYWNVSNMYLSAASWVPEWDQCYRIWDDHKVINSLSPYPLPSPSPTPSYPFQLPIQSISDPWPWYHKWGCEREEAKSELRSE